MTPSGAATLPLAVVGFVLAAAVAFLLTPVAARLATAAGAIDQPDAARRVHRAPVPRGGGLAVVAAFLLVAAGAGAYAAAAHVVPQSYILPLPDLASLFGGAVAAALLGFVDDRFDIRARWQLVAQIALAAIALAAGIRIGFINNPLGFVGTPLGSILYFDGPIAALVTGLWVVGMINSINFVDGLDGLSSGVGVIAALTLGAFSLTVDQNEPFVALLCFVLAGALAGFLPWNFHPARIFVGTTGVFALGYALAVLSILGTAKVAVALLVLGVPIIDTFWIIVRRLAQGKSPFTADRGHFHHRLLDLGLSHREAVLVIYLICAMLAVLSFVLSGTNKVYAFMGIVIGGGLVLYLLTRRSQEALEATSYDDVEQSNGGSIGSIDVRATGGGRRAGADDGRHGVGPGEVGSADGLPARGAGSGEGLAGAGSIDGLPARGAGSGERLAPDGVRSVDTRLDASAGSTEGAAADPPA